jgi:hypothetical protein
MNTEVPAPPDPSTGSQERERLAREIELELALIEARKLEMPSTARRWTGEPAPTITVSAARPAEFIAHEIVRRLLPEAQRYWERQEEREARLVAYDNATARPFSASARSRDRHDRDHLQRRHTLPDG